MGHLQGLRFHGIIVDLKILISLSKKKGKGGKAAVPESPRRQDCSVLRRKSARAAIPKGHPASGHVKTPERGEASHRRLKYGPDDTTRFTLGAR